LSQQAQLWVGDDPAPLADDPAALAGEGAMQQLQEQGGQVSPGAQAGQAQAQPPPPLPGTGLVCEQTPVWQGVVTQAIPSWTQPHASAVSAVHDVASVNLAHGSAGTGFGAGGLIPQPQGAHAAPAGQAGQPQTEASAAPVEGGLSIVVFTGWAVPLPVVPEGATPTAPWPQPHAQGGQFGPVQAGQAQAHVPEPLPPPQVPPPEPPLPPPLLQSHAQGGQAWPGPQAGQVHVQVPPPVEPPPVPPVEPPPPEQSHCTAGQSAPAGQTSGWTQVHPPPETSRAWQ
jgi:hypothetical protein